MEPSLQQLEEIGKQHRAMFFNLAPPKNVRYKSQDCRFENGCTENKVARRYADLCDKHATQVYQCEIKPSTLNNKRMGLFALSAFNSGDVIDLYEGQRLPARGQIINSTVNQFKVPVTFYTDSHKHYIIDSTNTQSCIARYINHSTENTNCRLQLFKPREYYETYLVAVMTTQEVDAGSELFIDFSQSWTTVLSAT